MDKRKVPPKKQVNPRQNICNIKILKLAEIWEETEVFVKNCEAMPKEERLNNEGVF